MSPGLQIKNWPKYHALRRKGYSKAKAARIANTTPKSKRRKKRKTKKK